MRAADIGDTIMQSFALNAMGSMESSAILRPKVECHFRTHFHIKGFFKSR